MPEIVNNSTVDRAYTVHTCTVEMWAVHAENGRIGRVVAWREFRTSEPDQLDRVQLDPIICWPGTVAASTGTYRRGRATLYARLVDAERAAHNILHPSAS